MRRWVAALGGFAVALVVAAGANVYGYGLGGPIGDIRSVSGMEKIYTAEVTLTNTTIVGSAAGDIGHASGATVVPAVTGKRIMVREGWCKLTFATAAYTGGGTVSLRYSDTPASAITNTQTAAATFQGTTDRHWDFNRSATINTGATGSGVGAAVIIATGTPFTDPGTAAGTARCMVYYQLVDF